MTLVMAVRRPSFVVLGTDRLAHTFGPGPVVTSNVDKLLLHPGLPLALATSGLGDVPIEGHPPIRKYLQAAIRGLTDPADLSMTVVMQRIKSRLGPIMDALVRYLVLHPLPLEQQENMRADITIALVRDQQAALGLLRLGVGAKFERRDPLSLEGPYSVLDCWAEHYMSLDELGGSHLQDPLEIAAHIRHAMHLAIAAEASTHGGQNVRCGGGVDVALIDAAGARLIADTPRV